jgi:TrmH family RNA methyltransferase
MGNEARGVSEELLTMAEKKIYIPMAGRAESLNVAVAAGILLFAYGYNSCQSK